MERKVRSRLMTSIRRQNPLQGRFADPERPGDTCAGRTLLKLQTTLPMLCGDGFASFIPACLVCLRYPFPLPLQHHFPFELGDFSQHRQHELAGKRLGVHPENEFRPAIPRSGCSPALPVSASPTRPE